MSLSVAGGESAKPSNEGQKSDAGQLKNSIEMCRVEVNGDESLLGDSDEQKFLKRMARRESG